MRTLRIVLLSLLAIGVSIALAKPGGVGNQVGAVQPFDATATNQFTTFNVPGAKYTYPSSINPAGMITGWYEDANQGVQGFLRTP